MLQATLNSKPENLRTILVREVGEMSTKPHTSLCMLLQFFEKEKIMLVICFLTLFCIQIGQLVIGQGGIFSTPAVSCIIRKMKATGWNTCLWILIVICIMMLAYPLCSLYWLSLLSINNYPSGGEYYWWIFSKQWCNMSHALIFTIPFCITALATLHHVPENYKTGLM